MHTKMLSAAALTVLSLSACMSRPVVVENPAPEPVYAPSPSYPAPTQDMRSLHDRVHSALMSGMGSAANDISVRVDGSVVYLSGHVGSQADHNRAHEIAHDVAGVTNVDHSGLVVH